jgi:hypothetical protein
MSWDGILINIPKGWSINDIPADWEPPIIGSSQFVDEKFHKLFPDGAYEPEFCFYDGIEFYYGAENKKDVLSIGIRTLGTETGIKAVFLLCREFNLSLIDFSTGEVVETEEDFWQSMNAYRNWANKAFKR